MTRLHLVTPEPSHSHKHKNRVVVHLRRHRLWWAAGTGLSFLTASFVVHTYASHFFKAAEISLAAVLEAIINKD